MPVLMYHSVAAEDEAGVRPYFRLSTSPARFREQLRILADDGYRAVSLERALEPPGGQRVGPAARGPDLRRRVRGLPHARLAGARSHVLHGHGFPPDGVHRRDGTAALQGQGVPDVAGGQRAEPAGRVLRVAHRQPRMYSTRSHGHRSGRNCATPERRSSRRLAPPSRPSPIPMPFRNRTAASSPGSARRCGNRATSPTSPPRSGASRRVTTACRIRRLPVNGADDAQLFSAKLVGGVRLDGRGAIGMEEGAMTHAGYVVITPVRNEAAFVGRTIDSMAAQTVQPLQWVIVDDGSTDGTAEVLDQASRRLDWLTVVRRPDRGFRKSGGGVVEAFEDGYASLRPADWEFLVKLDGDLSFDPDYFETCLARFADEPQLGVAGGLSACWRKVERRSIRPATLPFTSEAPRRSTAAPAGSRSVHWSRGRAGTRSTRYGRTCGAGRRGPSSTPCSSSTGQPAPSTGRGRTGSRTGWRTTSPVITRCSCSRSA